MPDATWKLVAAGDYDGDGKADLFWHRDTTGENYMWFMHGAAGPSSGPVIGTGDPLLRVVAGGDFNGDGKADVFWRRDTGENVLWMMNGTSATTAAMPVVGDTNWKVVAPK